MASNKRAEKRMKAAVAFMQKYMATYSDQVGYETVREETFIYDVLYGLGIALSDDFRFADGFDRFKAKLRSHLQESDGSCEAPRPRPEPPPYIAGWVFVED